MSVPSASAAAAAKLRATAGRAKSLLDVVGFAAAQGHPEDVEACLATCREGWTDRLLNQCLVNFHQSETRRMRRRSRLAWACYHGRAERVAQLLSYGADVSMPEGLMNYAGDLEKRFAERLFTGQANERSTFHHDGVLPIELAYANGHTDIVRTLALLPGADPAAAVCPAAHLGLTDVVQELIKRGLDLKAAAEANKRQATPVLLAARGGHISTVRVLAEAGCPLNMPEPQHAEAIGFVQYDNDTPVTAAARAEHTDVVEYLAGRPDVDLTEALVAACRLGLTNVAAALLARGANVNGVSLCGWMPLVEATRAGDAVLVHALLERGAKPVPKKLTRASSNASIDGLALPLACFLGHTAIVRDLLAHGAALGGPSVSEKDGFPIIRAAHGGHADLVLELAALPATPKDQALWAAAYTDQVDVVTALLSAGAPLTFSEGWVSALGAAAARGYTAVMAELIKAGAAVNDGGSGSGSGSGSGGSAAPECTPPLTLAAACGQLEAARLLCQYGVDVNGSSAARSSIPPWLSAAQLLGSEGSPEFQNVQSPMHGATAYGHTELALFLAQQPGLDVNKALQHAVLGKCAGTVVQALLDRGADPNAPEPSGTGGGGFSLLPSSSGSGVGGAGAFSFGPAKAQQKPQQQQQGEPGAERGPTVLTLAVKQSSKEAARVLIQHPQTDVQPSLLPAVCAGHADLVQAIAARGAQLNKIVKVPALGSDAEYSALQAACVIGNAQVVRVLLEAGADVNVATARGDLPQHLATGLFNKSQEAPGAQRAEVLRLLVSAGADLSKPSGTSSFTEGRPVLHMLTRERKWGKESEARLTMVQALLELGADVNQAAEVVSSIMSSKRYVTPLEEPLDGDVVELLCRQPTINLQSALVAAAAHGLPDSVRDLVRRGADFNRPDHRGHYPLVAACTERKLKSVQVLVELGADVNVVEQAEEGFAYTNPTVYKPLSPIRAASGLPFKGLPSIGRERGDADIVSHLASHPSIDLAEAAVAAAATGRPDVIAALAARGADFNKANGWGELPVLVAASRTLPDAVTALIRHGANPNGPYTGGQEAQGHTPLMLAATKGGVKTVQALCEGGADVAAVVMSTPPAKTGFGGFSMGAPSPPPQPIALTVSKVTWQAVAKENVPTLRGFAVGRYLPEHEDYKGVVAYLATQPGADPVYLVKAAVHLLLPDTVRALIARGLTRPALVEGLVQACRSRDAAATPLLQLLLSAGADVNGVDSEDETALDACGFPITNPHGMGVAEKRVVQAAHATALIRHPAIDLSEALITACRMNDAGLVREVIGRGADVNKAVPRRRRPSDRPGAPLDPTPIKPLDEVQSMEIFRALAEAPSADTTAFLLKAVDNGYSSRFSDATVARAMIERGADINAADRHGNTVLDLVHAWRTDPSITGVKIELERRGAKRKEQPGAPGSACPGASFGAPQPISFGGFGAPGTTSGSAALLARPSLGLGSGPFGSFGAAPATAMPVMPVGLTFGRAPQAPAAPAPAAFGGGGFAAFGAPAAPAPAAPAPAPSGANAGFSFNFGAGR